MRFRGGTQGEFACEEQQSREQGKKHWLACTIHFREILSPGSGSGHLAGTRGRRAIGRKAGGEKAILAGLPQGDWANDEEEREGCQEVVGSQ